MFCYRDYQLTTRFNQQNKKSTSDKIVFHTLTMGTVISHFDYAILAALPKVDISKLHHIQNNAAK